MPWTNTFRGGQKLLRWRVRFLDGREPRSQHFVKEEDLRVIRCPHGPFFDRVESLRRMSPELVADVYLYPTDAGGRRLTAQPGWGLSVLMHEIGGRSFLRWMAITGCAFWTR
jgi:hypothetical protein